MRLRKLLRFFLPYGIVDLSRNRGKLRQLGRNIRPNELFGSDWLIHEAEQTGLSLFAPGHVETLSCVVDVGANAGQWSGMLLDLVRPKRLIIIEPEPKAFSVLRQRFEGESGVELHNIAIGDRDGQAKLKITRDTTGASLLKPREEMRTVIGSNWTVESEIAVELATLDRLLGNQTEISLVKIDVQGSERQVLAGASRTLSKTKFVLMELNYMPQYEGGSWLGDVHEILTGEHGFFLANASKPLVLNGHASMCDGLYVNPKLVPNYVTPDFV